MNEVIKSVTVSGYRKKHKFEVKRIRLAGFTFINLVKDGNVILNCKESEYVKFKNLFV